MVLNEKVTKAVQCWGNMDVWPPIWYQRQFTKCQIFQLVELKTSRGITKVPRVQSLGTLNGCTQFSHHLKKKSGSNICLLVYVLFKHHPLKVTQIEEAECEILHMLSHLGVCPFVSHVNYRLTFCVAFASDLLNLDGTKTAVWVDGFPAYDLTPFSVTEQTAHVCALTAGQSDLGSVIPVDAFRIFFLFSFSLLLCNTENYFSAWPSFYGLYAPSVPVLLCNSGILTC